MTELERMKDSGELVRKVLFAGLHISWCWLLMQAVHEFGHVAGAILCGGEVQKVVLHPFAISRTDVSLNPNPALVVWSGPLFGSLVPVGIWGIWRWFAMPFEKLVRFTAGFCLISNGLYIGVGCWWKIGDCEAMLQTGSPIWLLFGFGLLATAFGFLLLNRTGSTFGFGDEKDKIDWIHVFGACVLLVGTALPEFLLSHRI